MWKGYSICGKSCMKLPLAIAIADTKMEEKMLCAELFYCAAASLLRNEYFKRKQDTE